MTPLFVVVEDVETHATSRHAFLRSPVRVGRSELNELPLPLPFVSSWHAVIRFDEREVTYVDLGSTNGSCLDGAPLERNAPVQVAPGSDLRIGTLRLRVGRGGALPAAVRPTTRFDQRVSELRVEAPPPRAEPLAAPDQALVEQALGPAALDLDLLYASYRGAWEHLRGMVEQTLMGLTGPARAEALRRLAEKYGALAQEPQFRALAQEAEPSPAAEPAARSGGPTTDLVVAFGRAYLPEREGLAAESAQALLARTAAVLETFGKSYLELRKGYEEFGREMGVSAVRGDSPVSRARDARELLAFLLDLRAEGRTGELQAAFADLMLHQVALLNGVVEGARGLLERLSPDAVAAEASHAVFRGRASERWKLLEERWHALADEEEGLSSALFGAPFAKAYAAVIGRRLEDASGGAAGRRAKPASGEAADL